jgi:hypothetical protein
LAYTASKTPSNHHWSSDSTATRIDHLLHNCLAVADYRELTNSPLLSVVENNSCGYPIHIFNMFKLFLESSVQHLYDSAVLAFPFTQARQHLIHTIACNEIRLTPFLGMNTLLVRGSALNEDNDHHYNPIILFKRVNFHPEHNIVPFIASDNGQEYQMGRLSLEGNHALVKCGCLDFDFRFRYYNHLDHSLWNKNRKPYIGQGLWEANPLHLPGLCKHLMKLSKKLQEIGLIT